MRRRALLMQPFCLALLFHLCPGSVHAQETNRLVCDSDLTFGMIIGSYSTVDCSYTTSDPARPVDRYVGNIYVAGPSVGIRGPRRVSWRVSSKGEIPRGSLTGKYAGAGLDIAILVGAGPGVGLAGSSFALIPEASSHYAAGLAVEFGRVTLRLQAARER